MPRRRKGRYANPSERVRFGSMRYIPPFSTTLPGVLRSVASGATVDLPLPADYVGATIWSTYFTSAPGDRPYWVLNNATVQQWPIANVAQGLQGDAAQGAFLSAWAIAVPVNAVAIRIGVDTASHLASIVVWKMGSANSAGSSLSSQGSPFVFAPIPRGQAFVIAACISAGPRMSTISSSGMGLVIGTQFAILGAARNTIGVAFPCTYSGSSNVGFYQWYTDSEPPTI